MSQLVNGLIPANEECPYKKKCTIATIGDCYHKGEQHQIDFSCAAARGFVIIKK